MRADTRSVVDVGIDLGGSKTAVTLMDADGRVRGSGERETRGDAGPAAVMDDLVTLIREMLAGADAGVRRIGVGVCGQVVRDTGAVRSAPNLAGWTDVPLATRLRDAFGVPVAVANDVDVIALGEWRHGAGRGVDDLAVVYVGTGVGAGVVTDGRLLRGHGGYAAEVGHMTVEVDGRACTCGNRGCLEAYAGGWAIAARGREAAGEPSSMLLELAGTVEAVTAETVAEAHRAGDRVAGRIVAETARYLGAGLVSIVNAFNPRRLVLGGGILAGFPELLEAAHSHVQDAALAACTQDLEIVSAELGAGAGAVGAIALARELHPDSDGPEPATP